MFDVGLLAILAISAAIVAAVWAARWIRHQQRLDLSRALDVPWYLWPLMRLAVYLWKLEAHKELFKACGWSKRVNGQDVPTRRASRYISIRRRDDHYWIKIRVVRGFDQGDEETDAVRNAKRLVVNQARGTFDIDPQATWKFRLYHRHVILTPKEVVPSKAPGMAPDVAAVIAANLTPTTVVPAIGKGDRPIIHDAEDDAPHVLISGTTHGGGKTSTLRTFGIQYYSTGADLLIVDTIRQFSHVGWAIDPKTQRPWPGIVYADTTELAAAWLVRAGKEMVRRGDITKQAMLRGETVTWPRLVIMCDDVNGLQAELKRGGHDEALHYKSLLLWVSRGVAMCCLDAYQRGSAHAAGGGDNREAYGLRIWADGSGKTGDMLADQIDKANRPKPKPHTIQPGHSVFIYGSLAFEAQRIYYTDTEARTIVATAANRRQAIPATSWLEESEKPAAPLAHHDPSATSPAAGARNHSGLSPSQAAHSSMQEIEVISHIDKADGEINYLALRDVASREWCPYRYHTIRKYASDPELDFPAPIEGFENPRRWSERDVRDWLESRQAAAGDPGVYVIDPPYSGTVKIGETKRLEGRLDEFAMANRDEVVKHWFPCASKKQAQGLELWLHRKYDRQRVDPKAEWFRKDGRLARDLDDADRLLAGCPQEWLPERVAA